MAAGLKTILFNVATDGADLDHAPPKYASSLPVVERTILNSIPLGGIIRDSILSSSLPNSYSNNNQNSSSISGGEATDNYLEPVIVAAAPPKRDGRILRELFPSHAFKMDFCL